jgi:hypothetical protein
MIDPCVTGHMKKLNWNSFCNKSNPIPTRFALESDKLVAAKQHFIVSGSKKYQSSSLVVLFPFLSSNLVAEIWRKCIWPNPSNELSSRNSPSNTFLIIENRVILHPNFFRFKRLVLNQSYKNFKNVHQTWFIKFSGTMLRTLKWSIFIFQFLSLGRKNDLRDGKRLFFKM